MESYFYTKTDPDIVVEKIIHEDGYIDYNIKVDHRTRESGLTEFSVDEELNSEDWRDDVIIIDRRDPNDICSFCNKKIYDCVECENNLFNIILKNNV